MSTERELLELAAKAAGYDTQHPMNARRLELNPPVYSLFVRDSEGFMHTAWDPIADNGDALRLAVQLNLIPGYMRYSDMHTTVYEGDAKLAETRLAIVRAAAEIGRDMP